MLDVAPQLLMGEAGICGFMAMIAVAYVYQRNPVMYGWQEDFSDEAKAAALFWPWFPDYSYGASYVFSFRDMRTKAVRLLIRGKWPKIVFRCQVGGLVFY